MLNLYLILILSSLTLALENVQKLSHISPKSVFRFPSASIKVSSRGSKREHLVDQKPSETHEHGDHGEHEHENHPYFEVGAGNHQFFQWMDTYLLQKGPNEYEVGHLSEDPHGWELRFERVDGNVKQGKYEFGYRRGNPDHFQERFEQGGPAWTFKTKVKWGDKKGGYGESYWDYNHIDHKYNQQNDHHHHKNDNDHQNHHSHQPHGPNQDYGESSPTIKLDRSPQSKKVFQVLKDHNNNNGLRKSRYFRIQNGQKDHPIFKASALKTSQSSAILIVPSPKLDSPKSRSFSFPTDQKPSEKSLIKSSFTQ